MALRKRTALLVLAVIPVVSAAAESPRITPVVQLVERVEPAVVAVFSQSPDGNESSGSGSIIHPDGFILTADHVVRDRRGMVILGDGSLLPYRTVGRLPEKDLALIKVEPKLPLKCISLGRTDDLKTGEPVLVGGNPGGRGIVFSSGIVSSPAMMVDAPSVLAMTLGGWRNDTRDRYIQFDATSNPGNSGGPVINAEGAQIGVVTIKFFQEQNVNFAIPIDRVRRYFA